MTTTSDLPTLRLRLAEAELAEHKLATGTKRVTITYSMPGTGTQSVTYTAANMPDLLAYIERVKAKIAMIVGDDTGCRQPLYHW